MGKNSSKHECFLVNAHLNKALEEQIWKKTTKTGYNLANYNMNQSLSELSICLEDKPDNKEEKDRNKDSNKDNNKDNNIPLKVELPPIKEDNDARKVFVFDQDEDKEKGEKESRLNIEEFECGVHFGGGENSKQEWSFTLYDFDGHGKITKEDLVGLLKALYDAVGSSIKIPNNGTKTLKLRLSVGQDAGAQGVDPMVQSVTVDTTEIEVKKDGDVSPKKKDNVKNKENIKQKDSPKSKVKEFSRLNNLMMNKSVPAKCTNEMQAQHMSASTSKSRLTSQKHKELAELVQQNMERNHIKPLRRHHSDCRGCHQEHPHHKRRHRGPRTINTTKDNNVNNQTSPPANLFQNNADADDTPRESQDRRNYYLDLAGVENTSSKFQTPETPTTALHTELFLGLKKSNVNTSKCQPVKSATALTAGKFCVPRHFRSRSHELHGEKKCDNVKHESEQLCQHPAENMSNVKPDHLRSRSFDPQESFSSPNVRVPKGNPPNQSSQQKQSRYRPVSLPAQIPETVSPHYHRRHRHREKDHDMAMQQVAEWIEREHTLDIEGDRIVIQRHEHHHVHEHHHHHHYHHYYEA